MLANLACPFGVGCQLSGSQGGGISNSASRGKGDFPFPHEDRRDVTLWRLYVFFACRGFRKCVFLGNVGRKAAFFVVFNGKALTFRK